MSMHTTPFTVEFLGTPEAGKTTMIQCIHEELSKNMKVSILQESAEIVPSFFPKGSIDAHFWMRLTTARGVLEKKFSSEPYQLILVDREIIDTFFWDYYYGINNVLSQDKVSHANAFFEDLELLPNLVIFLSTTPEESIHRRGGEGRIVTLEFVNRFNEALFSFMEHVSIPVYHLDTTQMSKDMVFHNVLNEIKKNYIERN